MQANPYEETSPAEWNRRASAVKEAFVQSYDWYERLAFPKDEWKPLAGKGTNMQRIRFHRKRAFRLTEHVG